MWPIDLIDLPTPSLNPEVRDILKCHVVIKKSSTLLLKGDHRSAHTKPVPSGAVVMHLKVCSKSL